MQRKFIRERVVNEILANIDLALASKVATNLGIAPPKTHTVDVPEFTLKASPALSQQNHLPEDAKGKKIAVLLFEGVSDDQVQAIKSMAEKNGITVMLLGRNSAPVNARSKKSIEVDGSITGEPSIAFDAVVVPDGDDISRQLLENGDALHFLYEAYKHLKVIALTGDATEVLSSLPLKEDAGLLSGESITSLESKLMAALKAHRVWDREKLAEAIPA